MSYMPQPLRWLVLLLGLAAGGCTPWRDYVHNGFKVGPNYLRPAAPVAPNWIDAHDARLESDESDLQYWWVVFNDPTLNALVDNAVQQNLSLREAGFRVLQARAARGIAAGALFPQQQDAGGGYSRIGMSRASANSDFIPQRFYDQWDAGFNLAWELDFWGRFRRAIEAADADLDATIENYDQVVVTLLADVASTYVEIRTLQQRLILARQNVALQRDTFTIADARFRGGQVSELDVDQATSNLAQTEALIPQLEVQLRQATNRLCVLLGMPPEDMIATLGWGPIPLAPAEVSVGIPAELLRRRPDVRRAERQVAAQSARVGVATSELYPHIGVTGTIGVASERVDRLFTSPAFQGSVGPSFQWNILNYGRLLNNIRREDALLAELIVSYQNQVLQANAEVENGLVQFLRSQERAGFLGTSVGAAEKGSTVAVAQYRNGTTDFNRVALVQQNLVEQQDLLMQARGDIAQGLIEVYRALGGGWQIRLEPGVGPVAIPPGEPTPPTPSGETLPKPEAQSSVEEQPEPSTTQRLVAFFRGTD